MGKYEEDDDYEGERSKRKRLIDELRSSKITNEEMEDIVRLQKCNRSPLFSVAPCEITEQQFYLRYGLLTSSRRMPAYDRFQEVEMSDDALRLVSALMAGDVATSSATLPHTKQGAQQLSSILDRFLRALVRFTRIPGTVDPAASKKAGLLVEQVVLEAGLPVQEPSSQPSSEWSDELEGIQVAAQASSPTHHSDFKVYVLTERNTLDGTRLKIVDDFKMNASERDVFQSAMYTIEELETTSKFPKEYRPPVYLLAQDMQNWYYAILEIDGYVQIKKGVIDPTSLQAFPETHQPAQSSKFSPSITRAEVLERFHLWKKDMDAENMPIPEDVLHPVGRLFYRLRRYEVPRLSAQQTTLTESQKKLYDGLLKIVVGRYVVGWSQQDVVTAWKSRSFMQIALDTSGIPKDLIGDIGYG